jgi:hypothetical protein
MYGVGVEPLGFGSSKPPRCRLRPRLGLCSLQTRVSRPGEFRPEALAEPYVRLSPHTAPIEEPPRNMNQWAKSSGERRETAISQRLARWA